MHGRKTPVNKRRATKSVTREDYYARQGLAPPTDGERPTSIVQNPRGRIIRIKYDGWCRECGVLIPAGRSAYWTKTRGLRCVGGHG